MNSGDSSNLFTNRILTGNFNRFFVQPGIGIKEGNFQYGLTVRFSMLDFGGIHGMDGNKSITFKNNPVWFYEPALIGNYFYKKMYFNAQLGFSSNLTSLDPGLGYVPIQLSLGLGLRLGYKLKD